MFVFIPELFCFLFIFLFFVRIYFSDCDAFLHFYDIFGAKREQILRGKVVWITRASSGIGECLAYELTKFGCKLVLSARRREELERVKTHCAELVKEYSSKNPNSCEEDIFILPLDVTECATHKDVAASVLQKFGKIDILVNGAGILQKGDVIETWLECDQAVMETNVIGTISLTKAVLPDMVKRKSGQIVVISSASGKSAYPGISLYAASKHAIQGYFNTLRIELHSSNVGVTLVCPGLVYSSILKNALRENPETRLTEEFPPTMTIQTERCVHLITVAMANRLDEVWIALPLRLATLYLAQYFPLAFNRLALWKFKRV